MSFLYFRNYKNPAIDTKKLVFGFDMDSTLIEYDLDSTSYKYRFPNVLERLKQMSQKYNLIIVTNQNHNKIDIVKKKIQNLVEELTAHDIQISVYCSREDSIYRKPNIGFKQLIDCDYRNNMIGFCGDSLGRPGDYSDTDLKFAINLFIPAYSPEEIFLSESLNSFPKLIESLQTMTYSWKLKPINVNKTENKSDKNDDKNDETNPNDKLITTQNITITYPKLNKNHYIFEYKPSPKEMVIMVGYPASGKTTIAKRIQEVGYLDGLVYDIVNRDKLKTNTVCLEMCENSLKNNNNVIIDNTNPDKKTREEYIKLGQKYKYKIICVEMKTGLMESYHNNFYRTFNFGGQLIPKVAYNKYKSRYKTPTIMEGFKEIIKMRINVYDFAYDMYYF